VLKRGFKSQCERRSLELRRRLGRTAVEPLRAVEVAEHHNVTVWSPDNVTGVPSEDIQHLLNAGHQEWSGFTLRLGNRHLIVANTAQSPRRQNSVIMHELAHIILGHELVPGMLTNSGHFVPSTYNQDQEDEAAWLGATLLLPRPALLWMRRQRMSDESAATHFGVSPDLLRWRIRMTGIDYQLALAARGN
jgi:Zn-dependent peptidase ImmA (M78 family)